MHFHITVCLIVNVYINFTLIFAMQLSQVSKYTHICTHTHSRICIYTHTYTHAIHTHICTHIHAHTHTHKWGSSSHWSYILGIYNILCWNKEKHTSFSWGSFLSVQQVWRSSACCLHRGRRPWQGVTERAASHPSAASFETTPSA